MYVFDTSAFFTLGHYYPKRFPSLWEHINLLVTDEQVWSVREVRRELEANCPFLHIEQWMKYNRQIFRKPIDDELKIVKEIFKNKNYLHLVRRNHILKGLPVADPFLVAAAKIYGFSVVTQEDYKKGGARIPTVCIDFKVDCINVEQFLEMENIEL